MKNNSSTILTSIKSNEDIVKLLKSSKKINLPFSTIWVARKPNKSKINYGLLVNKNQFKLAVVRNKVKRQLRTILITSDLQGGLDILIKPNSTYLKKTYLQIKEIIINTIKKYQNGK